VNQPIKTTLDEIVDFLTHQGINHCVIGGLAFSARARTRTTDDVDLIIDCEPEAAVDQSDVQAIIASRSDQLDWQYLTTMAAQIEKALAIDLVDAVNRLRNG